MPGINSNALIDALASHAARLGIFENVTKHEPKSAPGQGLTAAIWVQHIGPVRSSGLRSTSALVIANVRVGTNMIAEPQDEIDPEVMDAVDKLFEQYTGNFTLDGLIRKVDVLGESGQTLQANAGYLTIGTSMYRVMVVQVPMIINDAWEQVA